MKFRRAEILNDRELAGMLSETEQGYLFVYDEAYFRDPAKPSISLTLPKSSREFRSPILFPFFSGLLAEGENKAIQCRILRLDEADAFTRLLKTAHTETVGAITVREIDGER